MNINEVLNDFLRSKRAAGLSPRTIEWYERLICVYLKWVDGVGADWLSPDDLEEFIDFERGRGLKDNSIDAYWRSLVTFFRWIKKRRRSLLDGNIPPTEILDRPKVRPVRPRQADYVAVCKLIASIAPANWLDYRDRALIQLMLSTGLRVEEVISLHGDRVNLSERFILVENGKGGKDRLVPFDGDFAITFTAYIYNHPTGGGDLLFLAGDKWYRPTGQGMTTTGVRLMLRRRCDGADVKYINPHSIRHLFAIKALNDGVQLSAVSTILGHASVSFTARVYAKWVKSGLRREYDTHWQLR